MMDQRIEMVAAGANACVELRDKRIAQLERELAECKAERDSFHRDLNEIFDKSTRPFIDASGYTLGYGALETRYELALKERNSAFKAVALLRLNNTSLAAQVVQLEQDKASLSFQVTGMREALEYYAKEDVRNARHYPPEFAKEALVIDNKPAQEIINGIKAQALREAADAIGTYVTSDIWLRKRADELEGKK